MNYHPQCPWGDSIVCLWALKCCITVPQSNLRGHSKDPRCCHQFGWQVLIFHYRQAQYNGKTGTLVQNPGSRNARIRTKNMMASKTTFKTHKIKHCPTWVFEYYKTRQNLNAPSKNGLIFLLVHESIQCSMRSLSFTISRAYSPHAFHSKQ